MDRRQPFASSNRVWSRWPMVVGTTVAAVLPPWCVFLALTMPATAVAAHWSLAWVGLDLAEAACAASTCWFIRRCSPLAALTSAMGAALLLVDAWFDVCTSGAGAAQVVAVMQAVLLEIPLACAALAFAVSTIRRTAHSQPVRETSAGHVVRSACTRPGARSRGISVIVW